MLLSWRDKDAAIFVTDRTRCCCTQPWTETWKRNWLNYKSERQGRKPPTNKLTHDYLHVNMLAGRINKPVGTPYLFVCMHASLTTPHSIKQTQNKRVRALAISSVGFLNVSILSTLF